MSAISKFKNSDICEIVPPSERDNLYNDIIKAMKRENNIDALEKLRDDFKNMYMIRKRNEGVQCITERQYMSLMNEFGKKIDNIKRVLTANL